MKIERLLGSIEEGLTTQAGEPVVLVAQDYSAVMDLETCDACAKWDGFRFPREGRSLHEQHVTVPNHACTSKEGCRCVWIYITDKEAP